MSAGAVLARAEAVTKSFGAGSAAVRVLHDISLELHAGELVLVMGPSGSGKTTLVSILAGLMRPTTGQVELCGTSIAAAPDGVVTRVRRDHLGFIFQSFNLFPALTALDNVAELLALRGAPIRRARERAALALTDVGLGHRLGHMPGQLSGGERQRVAIARALAAEPALLIGDEPTAALDGSTAAAIIDLIRGHVGSDSAALLVTHDRRLERFADRVIEIEDGRMQRDGRASFVASAPPGAPS
jgi:putative ABC transport system ATP-binding protein